MKKKAFWFDVETTGFSSTKNDIYQLAYLIDIEGGIVLKRNLFLAPTRPENIQKKALEIGGKTEEEIMAYPPVREGYEILLSDMDAWVEKFDKGDKFYPGGYNVSFDMRFLSALFKSMGNNFFGSYFNGINLDPLSTLRTLHYKENLELENMKLPTVAKYFGIELDAHNALSDVEATREIFLKLMEKERE